ncbi:hypothetical protein HD553DRAFT_338404 [Filobasidium floriforme]|uniref:uncharacterized protein n=1 Tax=Filobasidium floriforme TaxID=5210 RepID=UPI001E8D86C5|nr:uncharacterized protein HD553DRAFT_338404 [Filobasidium floriforme]KAH8090708.1 hypothetical protein HD553DRAFT_338404 [Filobasidium floriforme]
MDELATDSATSPPETGSVPPTASPRSRNFSPAEKINPALQAVEEMIKDKEKRTKGLSYQDKFTKRLFLQEEDAKPDYPEDGVCKECRTLEKGRKYCVIGGGGTAGKRCARCLLGGKQCSFDPMRKRKATKASKEAGPSKLPKLDKGKGRARPIVIADTDSGSGSDSADSGSDYDRSANTNGGKLDQILELLKEQNGRLKRLERKMDNL